MRPKICIPIVEESTEKIIEKAEVISRLPVQMVEWRIDFFSGSEAGLFDIAGKIRDIIGEKSLIVTLRTEYEGGEKNGSRFPYFDVVEQFIKRQAADYVDVEIGRQEEKLRNLCRTYQNTATKIIGSFHDFEKTPSEDEIVEKLERAKFLGCDVAKTACMPGDKKDVEILLLATARMKKRYPDYPIITMSMAQEGVASRLYGGLYGSEVSFGCVGTGSAPGQVPCGKMLEVFDKIYSGKRHIFLIGFMGVGKSAVAKELSERTKRPKLDTDQWIEKTEGKSVSQIFKEEGEPYFREIETAMLDELGTMPDSIVSCGGGMALRDLNVRKMRALGDIVLLRAEPESIYERVKDSVNRPLLQGNMRVDYIRELMGKREPFYKNAADHTVFTDKRGLDDIAKEILEKCH